MDEVQKMLDLFKKSNKEWENLSFYQFEQSKHDLLMKFLYPIYDLAKDLKGYGYSVNITLDIYNGVGKKSPFTLCLNPFYDFDNKSFLYGHWTTDSGFKVCYSFSPSFDPKSEESKDKNSLFIDLLPFVFVQIYNEKEYIYELLRRKVILDMKQKIKSNNELIDFYHKMLE